MKIWQKAPVSGMKWGFDEDLVALLRGVGFLQSSVLSSLTLFLNVFPAATKSCTCSAGSNPEKH